MSAVSKPIIIISNLITFVNLDHFNNFDNLYNLDEPDHHCNALMALISWNHSQHIAIYAVSNPWTSRGPPHRHSRSHIALPFEVPGDKLLDQNCQVYVVYSPLRPKRAILNPMAIQNMIYMYAILSNLTLGHHSTRKRKGRGLRQAPAKMADEFLACTYVILFCLILIIQHGRDNGRGRGRYQDKDKDQDNVYVILWGITQHGNPYPTRIR